MAIRFVLLIFAGVVMWSSGQAEMIKPIDDDKGQAGTVSEIRAGLNRLNAALATKDLATVMSVYDNADDIAVVGSDSGEVFIGKERVVVFMKMILSMPFVFSFEMDDALINHDQNTAWAFVDSHMVHTRANGRVTSIPYRIMAVLVKRGSEWKWKVFSGSIPRGE
jgi:ketosteroid isomerase-like protein